MQSANSTLDRSACYFDTCIFLSFHPQTLAGTHICKRICTQAINKMPPWLGHLTESIPKGNYEPDIPMFMQLTGRKSQLLTKNKDHIFYIPLSGRQNCSNIPFFVIAGGQPLPSPLKSMSLIWYFIVKKNGIILFFLYFSSKLEYLQIEIPLHPDNVWQLLHKYMPITSLQNL